MSLSDREPAEGFHLTSTTAVAVSLSTQNVPLTQRLSRIGKRRNHSAVNDSTTGSVDAVKVQSAESPVPHCDSAIDIFMVGGNTDEVWTYLSPAPTGGAGQP